MVLSTIRLALNEDSKTAVNKLVSSAGEQSNVTVSSGDKRNIAGLLIWHPILLDSPFEEPSGKDQCWMICSWRGILTLFRRLIVAAEIMRRTRHTSSSRP
jgi:hypothetical protein